MDDDEKKEVERIPWKEFIRNQSRKIYIVLLMLVILFFIIQLSIIITPDPTVINPPGVISIKNWYDVALIVLSSILFFMILIGFTKAILIDKREEFEIESWKSTKAIGTLILTTSFISLIYILLDISLINIYLMTLPVFSIWQLQFVFPFLGDYIPVGTDRLAYSQIRSMIFLTLFFILFIFPVLMLIIILTRKGRKVIKTRLGKKGTLPVPKLIFQLVGYVATLILFIFVSSQIPNENIRIILTFAAVFVTFLIFLVLLILLFKLIRVTLVLTYSNILMIFPIIFLFYIFPGMLWGAWDLYVILAKGTTDNTIYSIITTLQYNIDPTTTQISSLDAQSQFMFYIQTVMLNLANVTRIIELDIIIIVGVGAFVIGFAEGFSLFSIVKSISSGVSVARTGKIATRSAPRIVVYTTQLIYLLGWLNFLFSKLAILIASIKINLGINLPDLDIPNLLPIIVKISFDLASISEILLVFTVLAVPFYFIVTSAFKFLSVAIVMDKIKEDRQTYYLLITSAFILIITNILADISSLPEFLGPHRQFLPFSGLATDKLLPFITKILSILEALAFYLGTFVSIIFGVQHILVRKGKTSD